MTTNVEIKARVRDLSRVMEVVEKLSETPCEAIPQEDTFFHTPNGRLKLRVLSADHGELVYYERRDAPGPKRSDFMVFTTSNPSSLKEVLSASLGVRGIVRKRRLLYRQGNTRIHLDRVEGLGWFLELEFVLSPEQGQEEGEAAVVDLMAQLDVRPTDLVETAYVDLLENRADEVSP